MLLKLGVDISRLKRQIRVVLTDVDAIFRQETGSEPVITSTWEGNHSPSSLHYANLAIDIRKPGKFPITAINKLKARLGTEYDIILVGDHIHIEHDPKILRKERL